MNLLIWQYKNLIKGTLIKFFCDCGLMPRYIFHAFLVDTLCECQHKFPDHYKKFIDMPEDK
jgi:hypothetical protein